MLELRGLVSRRSSVVAWRLIADTAGPLPSTPPTIEVHGHVFQVGDVAALGDGCPGSVRVEVGRARPAVDLGDGAGVDLAVDVDRSTGVLASVAGSDATTAALVVVGRSSPADEGVVPGVLALLDHPEILITELGWDDVFLSAVAGRDVHGTVEQDDPEAATPKPWWLDPGSVRRWTGTGP